MMIEIYMKEDKKFGVQYQKGILINQEKPLNPLKQSEQKGFTKLKKALKAKQQSDIQNIFQ